MKTLQLICSDCGRINGDSNVNANKPLVDLRCGYCEKHSLIWQQVEELLLNQLMLGVVLGGLVGMWIADVANCFNVNVGVNASMIGAAVGGALLLLSPISRWRERKTKPSADSPTSTESQSSTTPD